MNKIILLGNLTRDPELSATSGGKDYCNFSIAVNREYGGDGCDFFECVAFGSTADTIAKYFKKGKKILVEGRVKIDNYENNEGPKRRSWKVIVAKFYFVTASGGDNSHDDEDDYKPRGNSGSKKKPAPADFDDDSDIPF